MNRFLDIKKDFDSILELGSGAGHVCKYYQEPYSRWVLYDEARNLLFRDVECSFTVWKALIKKNRVSTLTAKWMLLYPLYRVSTLNRKVDRPLTAAESNQPENLIQG